MVIFRNLKLGVGGSGGIELNCKFTFKNIKNHLKIWSRRSERWPEEEV